jgi:predicted CoA-substrate-specific enzyme activase
MYMGCDLGTVAAKVVILEDEEILASEVLPYRSLPRQVAEEIIEKALASAEVSAERIDYCVSTGFGKRAVSFANAEGPEIVCLNRAVRMLDPDVRTVIDAGGHSIRVVSIGDNGKILQSASNEKCAAGTGKFIQVMAKALELPLEEVGDLPLQSKDPLSITSQCGVFAESEVITHVNDGKNAADIVAGIARSVANRISSLVRRVDLREKVVLVGGVALNRGVARYVQDDLNIELSESGVDPQLIGALGAALLAKEKHAAAR